MRKYTEDEKFMREAIKQAKKAEVIGDVPIGCVIVHDGKVIARGYNKRNKDKTVLADITEGQWIRTHWLTRSCRRSAKQAKKWMTGDWKTVRCILL